MGLTENSEDAEESFAFFILGVFVLCVRSVVFGESELVWEKWKGVMRGEAFQVEVELALTNMLRGPEP